MARYILESDGGDSVAWWPRNVVWIDPCASILPRTRQKYDRMRQAEQGNKKRLISDDAKAYARNLRGAKEQLKQNSFDAEKICWLMVLARGVVAVEVLPESWEVDGAGMAEAVELLLGVLRRMLGKDALPPQSAVYRPRHRDVRVERPHCQRFCQRRGRRWLPHLLGLRREEAGARHGRLVVARDCRLMVQVEDATREAFCPPVVRDTGSVEGACCSLCQGHQR